MCLHCGCGMYEDNMGSDKTITLKSLDEAAKSMGQTREEAIEEMLKSLKEMAKKN